MSYLLFVSKNSSLRYPCFRLSVVTFQNSPLLRAEIERVESHHPFPSLDTLRYQLPAPASTPATDEEWQAALKNAQAQLEHQRIRHVPFSVVLHRTPFITSEFSQTNLTLLQKYGANAWRLHNYLLESTAKKIETSLEALKQLTVEVNRDRKNNQVCNKFDCFEDPNPHRNLGSGWQAIDDVGSSVD